VLVRVPLGWTAKTDLCKAANPAEKGVAYDCSQKQTVEMRSPDASANVYLLMAGLAVACRYGFSLKDGVKVAEATYVNVNIHKKENAKLLATLDTLPDSCAASADCLQKQREVFEQMNVFSPAMIDGILGQLRAFDDRTLRKDIEKKPAEVAKLVKEYFYCG